MISTLKAPWLLIATTVLCVSMAFLAPSRAGATEPAKLYDGRTLDEWRQAIQQIDFRSPDRAAAVSGLLAVVRDPDAPWFTRRQAALTLGRIGEPARPAIPELIKLLESPVDPVETSPPLWAMKALALFGPLAKEAAPKAISILQDGHQPLLLRLTCTETLGRIGVASAEGIRALIHGGSAIADTSPEAIDLRTACIEALQLPRPPAAIPMLIAACDDSSERVRHAAAATLGYLGPQAEPAAEALGSMVAHDAVPVVRETAARSLAQAGQRGADVLLRLFSSSDNETLLLAIDGASRTSVNQKALAAGLPTLFDNSSPLVAARALDAEWRLTRQAAPILARLIVLVESDDRAVRKSASDTLIQMRAAAMPAAPELQRLAGQGNAATRTAARRILKQLPTATAQR